jgi:hypothetical protein
MVAAPGLVTSVYVGEEGPSLQLRTNGRFGSRLCKNSAEFSHVAGLGLFSRSEVDRK